jgi:outer membrane protein assembly factor BamD
MSSSTAANVFLKPLQFLLFSGLLAMGLVGSGCSGREVDENDPASLYSDAEEEISNDHYQIALDKLRIVKNKFPYSKFSIDAQLKIADVYFLQESWAEAAIAYETFRDLHPKHERVAYAMFRIGKSHFNDIPSPTARDLTPGQKAIDAYSEYLRRFPADPNVAEAKSDLDGIRKVMAEKELYIGNFYYRRDFYESARPRFEKILALYPDSEAAKEAKEKLTYIATLPKKEAAAKPADGSAPTP